MGIQEADLKYTPIDSIGPVVDKLKKTFESGRTLPVSYRKQQLNGVIRMLKDNRKAWLEAFHKDLRKSEFEGDLWEIDITVAEAQHLIAHLDQWAKPTIVANDVANIADKTMIRNDPKGTVLVIGAWNYPLQLLVSPMLGAIAAGCTAVAKPSEVSSHTAKLLGELIPNYLDQDAYAVVQGAVEETTQLLKYQWDHIFYTGNGAVGKVIMAAAAKHLTSVTLELGGKCPAIVSDDSDVDIVTSRILSGRLINTGQTCVCVDYVICTPELREKLVAKLKADLKEWYGNDIKSNPDYGRIVNIRHWNRIMSYLKATKGKVVIGGDSDEKDLFIAPTVVVDCDDSEPLMNEEIFGPILPIKTVKNLEEAVQFVNARPNPLALYMFSRNDKEVQYVLDRTRSGGVTVNDSLFHLLCTQLPFGGFGASGQGGYHGKFSFDTFVHKRATLIKGQNMEFINKACRYPKYNDTKKNMTRMAFFGLSAFALPDLPYKNLIIMFLVVLVAILMKS